MEPICDTVKKMALVPLNNQIFCANANYALGIYPSFERLLLTFKIELVQYGFIEVIVK